jgi:ABC-type lipoprotein release transport system permease subunit
LADVAAIASVAVLMIVIACAAAFFPVRRATRIDPMAALRHH